MLLKTAICLVFPLSISSDILPPNKDSESLNIQCLQKIYENSFVTNSLIIGKYIKINIHNINTTLVIINKNNKFGILSKFTKFQTFLIAVEKVDDLNNYFSLLYPCPCWNPRGKFLIILYSDDKLNLAFEILWSYYILNANIFVQQTSKVYTYFPYNHTSCGKEIKIIETNFCENNSTTEYYPCKIPKQIPGCEVKLQALKIPPYVININGSRQKPKEVGLEVIIINTIAKKINFTDKYVHHDHPHWGVKLSNGTYTLMFKDLFDKKVDIILGMTYSNYSIADDFDASQVHLIDMTVWYVPTAKLMAHWKNPVKIFNTMAWFSIFFSVIAQGFLWWIFKMKNGIDGYYFKTFFGCLMGSWSLLLQLCIVPPNSNALRTLFISWTFSTLILYTAHQCQLVSVLTKPYYEYQMKTTAEMLNSTLKFGFYFPVVKFFTDSDNWEDKRIVRDYVTCSLNESCLNRSAFHRDIAVAKNKRQTNYMIRKCYLDTNGKPKITPLENIVGLNMRYHVVKGFPLLDKFNDILLLLFSSGLISKWDKDITSFLDISDSFRRQSLDFEHLSAGFVLLAMGYICGFLVLICEILVYKIITIYFSKKKKDKINNKGHINYNVIILDI